MAILPQGKISLFLFLFITSRFSFSITFSTASKHVLENAIENDCDPLTPSDAKSVLENENDNGPLNLADRQEVQLQKLEDLVKNLTETVSRLESSVSGFRDLGSSRKEHESSAPDAVGGSDYSRRFSDAVRDGDDRGFEVRSPERERRERGITVTKYKPSWSERFQFLSAVKLEFEATCATVLPYEDYEGFSKYVAVGDERGRVYIFLSNGDVLVEFNTLSDSPVTSMLSYMSIWKNESFLVTGHRDGAVLVHRVWEAANSEDWHSLSMGNHRSLILPEKGGEDLSVLILETHLVGRMRYITCSDVDGRIKVFLENGTHYGTAVSPSRPLVFLKQRLLFLTERGAGSLDLRSMKVREAECEGLNGSVVSNYVFDASERSKAYGITSKGDLIHVVLLGDIVNFKCMVRAKRKTDMDGPLAVQAIKSYLLVVSQEKVFMFNVSSPNYIRVSGPRPLFFATIDEIKSSFLNSLGMPESSASRKPLVTSDREKLIVLGLGSGYVGIYRSNLPVFKAEFNTVLWSSPVVLSVVILIGAWQFLGKKREPLTPWGSDDPFSATSVTTGVSLGSGSGDRNFTDPARAAAADLMDLRGTALRGPSRRYVSPSRYPGGAATSFRPTSTDPTYRAATELTYRGQNLEMAGFGKRRDPLFPNGKGVEDTID
ncbi:uncharacterized membrane protein At1g75140-like [Magnolia sinica]|uniref:uncharacterized membrane protein At1g75140-like n=1 Tax=Magnolia sinica TaxID=86752 RepID=UPI002659E267|nr:uncharacterized membrane protein At1g75140-like [Magnolia sinica]